MNFQEWLMSRFTDSNKDREPETPAEQAGGTVEEEDNYTMIEDAGEKPPVLCLHCRRGYAKENITTQCYYCSQPYPDPCYKEGCHDFDDQGCRICGLHKHRCDPGACVKNEFNICKNCRNHVEDEHEEDEGNVNANEVSKNNKRPHCKVRGIKGCAEDGDTGYCEYCCQPLLYGS